MSKFSIVDNFSQHFAIKFADSKELRQEAFRIRHAVYAQELGWEPTEALELERDEYDETSYHCLLEHKRTKTFAGCIRLIIPPTRSPDSLLPFEKYCLPSVRKELIDCDNLRRGSFGEISRLAVLSSFRRRPTESESPFILNEMKADNVFSESERRNFPNIAMGLYLASIAMADICNHVGTFIVVEPKLNRRLQRVGLPFVQVGDEMDYHGRRAMFYLSRDKFYSELGDDLRGLYNKIFDDLATQLSLIPHTNPIDS